MFNTYASGTANNYDYVPQPPEFSRRERRAMNKGCKSCSSRIKGFCTSLFIMNDDGTVISKIRTADYGNDPKKIGCSRWTAKDTSVFGVPPAKTKSNGLASSIKRVIANARSRLRSFQRPKENVHDQENQQAQVRSES